MTIITSQTCIGVTNRQCYSPLMKLSINPEYWTGDMPKYGVFSAFVTRYYTDPLRSDGNISVNLFNVLCILIFFMSILLVLMSICKIIAIKYEYDMLFDCILNLGNL